MTLVERQKHDDRVSRLRIMSASLIARQLCRRDLDPIYAITVDRIAVSITIRTSPRSSSLVIFIFPIFTTVYVAISTRLFNPLFLLSTFSLSSYFSIFFSASLCSVSPLSLIILFLSFLVCEHHASRGNARTHLSHLEALFLSRFVLFRFVSSLISSMLTASK